MSYLFNRFLSSAMLILAASTAAGEQAPTSTMVREFAESGPPSQVIRKLARATYLRSVIGFENLDGTEHTVSVTALSSDLAGALHSVCAQDLRYQVVTLSNRDLINIVAADPQTRGHAILEFRISAIDIETDASPDNLIANLPNYSPILLEYLHAIYLREGGLKAPPPGAGAGFSGNAKLPHFSIHLTNVSVRELLNAISVQSLQMYRDIGIDPRLMSTPDQLRVSPSGWEYRFLEPRSLPFHLWAHQIFRTLQ